MRPNDYKKKEEIKTREAEIRKKNTFKDLTRSDEEKRLDLLELDLLLEKYNHRVIKHFLLRKDYKSIERVMAIKDYYKKAVKVKRLKPIGGLGGIMFIGVNPSERSNFINVWDDTFGKYFGKMLEEAGIDKEMVWMTNIYKYPTEGNRPLNDEEIKSSIDELKLEIKFVNPKVIVALGKQPQEILKKFFGDTDFLSLPHPAYIMRKQDPELRSKYLLELTKLKKHE